VTTGFAGRPGVGRPRRVWPLVLAGVVCLVVAGVVHVALTLDGLSGYRYWPEGSEVPRDGRDHVATVEPDEEFFVWVSNAENAPRHCWFTALPTGEPVKVRKAPSGWDRPGGVAGYKARLAGRVATGKMTVRCDELPSDSLTSVSPVYVEPPLRPRIINHYGPPWPLVVLPGMAGVLLLLAAAALWARRHVSGGQPPTEV
jgi:hypothetical protein